MVRTRRKAHDDIEDSLITSLMLDAEMYEFESVPHAIS
jgi:hypothetical protein